MPREVGDIPDTRAATLDSHHHPVVLSDVAPRLLVDTRAREPEDGVWQRRLRFPYLCSIFLLHTFSPRFWTSADHYHPRRIRRASRGRREDPRDPRVKSRGPRARFSTVRLRPASEASVLADDFRTRQRPPECSDNIYPLYTPPSTHPSPTSSLIAAISSSLRIWASAEQRHELLEANFCRFY